jgi:predicted Zn-dependent protease
MDSEQRWTELKDEDPALAERLQKDLQDVAEGRCGWAELLRIPDAELLGMARMAAAKLGVGRPAEAERTFWVLTELDPFVPWFWMALGDARSRLNKTPEAIEAYTRCLHEVMQMDPPSAEEIRAARLRRGRLLVRTGQDQAAYEDLKSVVELDTSFVADGEQAFLAIRALVEEGRLPEQALRELPAPR